MKRLLRSRSLLIAASVVLALLVLAALAGSGGDSSSKLRPAAERPRLMLLTSLPLVFGERFSLDGGGSKALEALETRYDVHPIAVADAASLRQGAILLMAHANAQPAEALVDLDRWVRAGGRLLLLADPLLEWESARGLGDPLRPSPMFPDTGLLRHWGLTLTGPDVRGQARRRLGGHRLVTVSPGTLSGTCKLGGDGFAAHCRIGKGQAIVVADADFLDVERINGASDNNLDALLAELAKLESN